MKKLIPALLFLCPLSHVSVAQDTFSMCAIDTITGEIGSAGASCVDLDAVFPSASNDFLSEIIPGKGVINTQASYDAANQLNARNQMNAGNTPSQIISWLIANDVTSNPSVRQYGIVGFTSPGHAVSAAHTGSNCITYHSHIKGVNYSIQGNILLGQKVLDSMESRFNREKGSLACKLMAALQGAKMIGADTRCTSNGTSSLFAFLSVAKPTDTFGNPSFRISVRTASGDQKEPIDSLQKRFNQSSISCGIASAIKTSAVTHPTPLISPNPFTESTQIVLKGRSIQKTEIFTALGESKKEALYEENTGTVTLNSVGLPAGHYVCVITDTTGNIYYSQLIVY
jgi:uncharacterized Ntn-hydrolase superfamily protein